MQAVGLHGIQEEQEIILGGKSEAGYFSRLAAAVTLSSGNVLITGGRHWEHEVFLLSGSGLSRWEARASMIVGRLGHAAIRLPLREESVMVAGGWDVGDKLRQGWSCTVWPRTSGGWSNHCLHPGQTSLYR